MSFLDNLLGGLGSASGSVGSADTTAGLSDLLQSQGGLGGLITKFGANGFSDAAASWIGKGENQAISAEQIMQVLGSGPIADFAAKLGVSPDQAAQVLSAVLPQLIDRMTPGGQLSNAENPVGALLETLPGGLGSALGSLFKR